MGLYRFLLEHMTDEQRFNLIAKLPHDVLGAIVDGTLPFCDDIIPILQDTLSILCCKVCCSIFVYKI